MIQKIKGTTDFYPEDQFICDYIYYNLKSVAEKFCFQRVEPPMIESIELLTAKSGDEIKNQIFTIEKKGKEALGLRFEFTASVARMFAEKQKALIKPVKWYSFNRLWRYERPQAGREREFFQFNCEIYGSSSSKSDSELIILAVECLKSLKLRENDFVVRINNRKLLMGLLTDIIDEDCIDKVLRVIDKKEKISKEDFYNELNFLDIKQIEKIENLFELKLENFKNYNLNSVAKEGFNSLIKIFENIRKVGYSNVMFDMSIVRGLDYYTGTVFEIFDIKKKFRAICGGGRYDNVIGEFGGTDTCATGFAIGYSTLNLLLESKKLIPKYEQNIDYFIVLINEDFVSDVFLIANKLRKKYDVLFDLTNKTIQKQLKFASKVNAKKIIFVGEDEIKTKKYKILDLNTKKTEFKKLDEI
ncbi:MAG: histidine--tRNA ligase [Nanoarchaeota archaeon]